MGKKFNSKKNIVVRKEETFGKENTSTIFYGNKRKVIVVFRIQEQFFQV